MRACLPTKQKLVQLFQITLEGHVSQRGPELSWRVEMIGTKLAPRQHKYGLDFLPHGGSVRSA
jgi:hypothetical protein